MCAPQKNDRTNDLQMIISEINQCRKEITAYNTQFSSSIAVSAVLAALAGILSKSDNTLQSSLFYILPSFCLYYIYNLIKYTEEILKLGSYREVLEEEAGKLVNNKKLFCWESVVNKTGKPWKRIMAGGFSQLLFAIPIAAFLLWSYSNLERNWLWYTSIVFTILQMAFIVYYGVQLIHVRNNTEEAIRDRCTMKHK